MVKDRFTFTTRIVRCARHHLECCVMVQSRKTGSQSRLGFNIFLFMPVHNNRHGVRSDGNLSQSSPDDTGCQSGSRYHCGLEPLSAVANILWWSSLRGGLVCSLRIRMLVIVFLPVCASLNGNNLLCPVSDDFTKG